MCLEPGPITDILSPADIELREPGTPDALNEIFERSITDTKPVTYSEETEEQEGNKFISMPVL